MEAFKNYLQQEFMRRTAANPAYSLRAFAQRIGMSHSNLSRILSGKRQLTKKSVERVAHLLGLGPSELEHYLTGEKMDATSPSYFKINEDTFSSMSEWYFDAILELSLLPGIKLTPERIAGSLDISVLQAKLALETLVRLELLKKLKNGRFKLQHKDTTNILDPNFTSAAKKKYQKSILEKSLHALENAPRAERDHTSTTMAVNSADLGKVKELIQKFRYDLNRYLQRDQSGFDEVYQLQVSFFSLTQTQSKRNIK